jgi:hypothetical protein
MPMAWIAGVIFSVTFLVHVYQYFKHKAFFLYLLLLGIAFELVGYWTRVVAIKDPENASAGAATYLFTTVAPSFIAAALYMNFSRIIYWVTPDQKRGLRYTWVPARWFSTIFISLDFVAFLIQCIGIFALIANAAKKDLTLDQQKAALKLTYDILKVGFMMQVANFSVFVFIALRFMIASNSYKFDWPDAGTEKQGQWRTIAWIVIANGFLIVARAVYRGVQFTINNGDNYLQSHEWTFYVLDFLPIISG